MASSSTNTNDSNFSTPKPEELQTEKNRSEVQQRVREQDNSSSQALVEKEEVNNLKTKNVDPDEVSRSGEDPTSTENIQSDDGSFNRQIGTAFRSGS